MPWIWTGRAADARSSESESTAEAFVSSSVSAFCAAQTAAARQFIASIALRTEISLEANVATLAGFQAMHQFKVIGAKKSRLFFRWTNPPLIAFHPSKE